MRERHKHYSLFLFQTLQCYLRHFVQGLQTIEKYHSLKHIESTFSVSATIMSTPTFPSSTFLSLVRLLFEVEGVVGVILVPPLVVPLPPFETASASPLLVTVTHRPALPHFTPPVVGAVALSAGMFTARNDIPPSLHPLHQLHLLPHHLHVPNAPDQSRLSPDEIAGGVCEGVAA